MPVSTDFHSSELDLNQKVSINSPTALVWGADGRLYVTEVDGDVHALTVAFGDPSPGDDDPASTFYVTEAETIDLVKSIPNFDDDGTGSGSSQRQVTGIDVTAQYDADGQPVLIGGEPAVVMYVSSSDSRIGAGGSGNDVGLDTNSGVVTKLVQTQSGWEATDLVRGLPRSEENHATNGLEVIQTFDSAGTLISERMIVASGGNANTGAPSNNFAGQQEQPLSGAILEIDLSELSGMEVLTDGASGRSYVYDLPTLDDPTRDDGADPFGGNDGLNSAKLLAGGPVQVYSAGYRNPYDVEVTDDGRVWTYDNGANNNWGGRPAGEDQDGDVNSTEAESGTPTGFIATNLFVEDNQEIFGNFNPQNWDQLHEVTRSDDLNGRSLSAGQGGAQLYGWDHPDFDQPLQLVYGGHPNPTRAEGARAGILYSPDAGVGNAKLMVSNADKGNGSSDFLEVVSWLSSIGYDDAFINATVVAVDPGVTYADAFVAGYGGAGASGRPNAAGQWSLVEDAEGPIGLPVDIDEAVAALNPIEGNYREAGYTDGAVDTGKGSINGLAEYTSSIFDDAGQPGMKGALIAASLNQGQYYVIGRDADGIVGTATESGRTVAADRDFLPSGGAPLGLASIGDDLMPHGNQKAFQGSLWGAVFKENGPVIEIFQPGDPNGNALLGVNNYAGQEPADATDNDLDGVDHISDPFEFDADNGLALAAGGSLVLNFSQVDLGSKPEFSGSIGDTGLLGAALDLRTPNRDAKTGTFDDDGDGQDDRGDGFPPDVQEDGLFDNAGNIIPGGNAPILQIKSVQDGTAIGGANTLRDGLHTGVRLADDVQRMTAEVEIFNWWADQPGGGRITGLTLGDGTQSNFVRMAWGDVDGLGAAGGPGVEIGIETDDSYVVLERWTSQAFADALATGGQKKVTLQLEVSDIGGGYDLAARVKVTGDAGFTELPLDVQLPEGVLRDVLDGTHQVSDGDTTLPSGAAVGVVAEKDDGVSFTAVDIDVIRIDGYGNEIDAATEAEAEAPGTDGIDTVRYTGPAATIELDPTVENFDGSRSTADVDVVANAADNAIRVGPGVNVITTGAGADTVRGTLDDLGGDTITDFSEDDAVLIEGLTTDDIQSVNYAAGSAKVTINGQTLIFDGPDFGDFDPEDGAETFSFDDTADGVRITSRAPLSPVVAIDAGGSGSFTGTLRGTELTFVGDQGGAVDGGGFTTPGATKAYSNGVSTGFDFPDTDLDTALGTERSSGGQFGYQVDVPEGTYLIDFIFSEIYFGGAPFPGPGGDGARVFDVDVEGVEAFANIDIHQEAGGNGKQLVKTYQVEVTDGSLDISFPAADTDQGKLSALVVWKVGGSFTPVDATAPVIESITLENPQGFSDGERTATVVVTDETAFDADDFAGLTGSVLSFGGVVPDAIADPVVALSNGGKTATLTFEVTGPGSAWPNGSTGEISVLAGAFQDAADNASAAASGGFVVQRNLAELERGQVVRAINLGTTASDVGDLAGDDDNAYGGAIVADTLITDAFGAAVALEADDDAYHTSPKPSQNANVDGKFGPTGSNPALDGSAYHTYRDSAAPSWTSTFDGFENGAYVVELHFAELFHDTAEERVGDFTVNGVPFGDDYDAFAAGGGADAPSVVRKAVTVTDGTIRVVVDDITKGEAGYSAIVVYDAVDSNLPPSLSVGDVVAVEGGTAEITVTRTGDLSEATTVDVALSFDATADAADVGALSSGQASFAAGAGAVTVALAITDDDLEEGVETLTVALSNASGDAVIADGTATLTIAASDSDTAPPVGATILELDFETAGGPTEEGGFDGVLGGAGAADAAGNSRIENGKLLLTTSNGDLSQEPTTASKNDFVRSVDLSDPALSEVYLTTRFDNPFASGQPDFIQQGIIVAVGAAADQQEPEQFQKLVVGGNGGDAAQIWSQGASGTSATPLVADMSAAAVADGGTAFTFGDVVSVELSMRFDKSADTTGMFVTFFDDQGGVLGGVRPETTSGFLTVAPVPTPPAVVAALNDGSSVVGVTSTDFDDPAPFEASWDFLRVSSPQFVVQDAPVTAAITGAATVAEDGTAAYDVTLSADPAETTTVTVNLAAGTGNPADLPADAQLAGGGTQVVLTFEPGGALTQSVTVEVADDTLPELAEEFAVSISGIGVTAGGTGSVGTTIGANDGPVDSVNDAAAEGGDFSDDGLAPTVIGTLAEGETTIVASQQGDGAPGGRERDYFTFTVAEGQTLTGIILEGWETDEVGTPQGFIGLQAGAQVTTDPNTFADASDLLGGHVYNSGDVKNAATFQDGNLLAADALGKGEETGQGVTIDFGDSFTPPLPAGSYTVWLNQGGDVSTATLTLVTAPVAETSVALSIADADPVLEADGAALSFDLAASAGFTGQVEVTFDAGDATGQTQVVSFADGVGVLTVPVADDDINDGDTQIAVTLTGATDQAANPQTIAIDTAAGSATGTVTEDDPMFPELDKGAFVFGINAGPSGGADGEKTDSEGRVFAAADPGEWTGETAFAPGGANDKDYDGDGAPDADDDVYESEYYGGKAGDPPLEFARGGIPAGDYVLTVKLAEIFASIDGARLFGLTVNGTPVADDLDIHAEVGQYTALDIDVPVTIADEGDGTGTLTVTAAASADNAKISALALYEAPADPDAVSISVIGVVVDEDAGVASVTFTRAGADDEAVAITYSTQDASAVAGTDYTAVSGGTVEIAAGGDGTATVDIPLIGNDVEDGDLAFSVSIDAATAATNTITVAKGEATVTLTDNDAPDPDDVDDDGVANAADPFAFDGDNGLGTVIAPGVTVRQDFAVGGGDPFSAEAGFTGIVVNPALSPAGASAADPYGDRTTEAGVSIAGDSLTVQSSEEDLFSTGTAGNNAVKDNYQSAVDVSGVDAFTVEAKVANPFFGQTGPASFASFGITMGAGGVDDYVKFVLGGSGNGPRVQLAQENSLTGGKEENVVANTDVGGNIDTSLAATVVFALDVDTVAGTVQGTATFLAGDGAGIGTIQTSLRNIAEGGSLAAAIAGVNPLTGGVGGLGYGISITDSGGAPGFSASWDYLELRGPEPVNEAPSVALANVAAGIAEGANADASVKVADIVVTDPDGGIGTNVLGLAGTDAAAFEIVDGDSGPELHVAAGATLDFEAQSSLDVAVTVDDPALGDGSEAQADLTLAVTDANEAPSAVTLTPTLAAVAEDADTTATVKVADIAVADDASGTNTLSLSGADEDAFTIVGGTELHLAAGATLDFETNPTLDVTVAVDDATVGAAPDASTSFSLDVADANDAPTLAGTVEDAVVASGAAGSIDLSGLVASDEDTGDTPTLRVELEGGDPLPAGITFDGTALNVADTVAADVYRIAVVAGDGEADSAPVTFALTVKAPEPGVTKVPFANLISYTSQDREVGAFAVEDDGGSLTLDGNTWKRMPFPAGYELTANTVLRFEVEIGAEGELQAIGLDTDNSYKNDGGVIYKIAGTQTFGDRVDKSFGGRYQGGVQTYEIPVGDLVGRDFDWITFINDRDQAPVGEITFSNLALVEAEPGAAPELEGTIEDVVVDEEAAVTINLGGLFNDADTATADLALSIDGLPDGLSLDPATGVVSGTLAADLTGTFDVTLTATDPQGNSGSGSFAIVVENVNDAPEVVGEIGDATFRLDEEFALPLPAGAFDDVDPGDAASLRYSAVGLPAGLNIDPTTGEIATAEGTPPAGRYEITVTATDPSGASSTGAAFALTILDSDAPFATAVPFAGLESYAASQDADVGAFSVAADGSSVSLTGNSWKAFDFPDYEITQNTVLRVAVTLSDTPSEVHGIGFDTDGKFRNDGTFLWQFAGTQSLSNFNRDFIDDYEGPGTVYMIPLAALAGRDPGRIVLVNDDDDASDGLGSTTFADLALVEMPPSEAPVVAASDPVAAIEEGEVEIDVAALISDADTPFENLTLAVDGLPDGLSLDPATGVVSGTLAADLTGTFDVTLTATDPQGNSGSGSFAIVVENVNDAPEVVGEIGDATFRLDEEFALPLPAGAFDDVDPGDAASLRYSAVGLPAGLNIDPTTGEIATAEGTPPAGRYEITVTATDPSGASSTGAAFALTILDSDAPFATAVPFAGLESYAASQDADVGAFSVAADGSSVSLTGNSWKAFDFPDYEITQNTVLRVAVTLSDTPSEVHGIGFDTDGKFRNDGTFLWQFAGTQSLSNFNRDFIDDYEGPGTVYMIPLAALAGRDPGRIVLVNDDDDASDGLGSTTFADLALVEMPDDLPPAFSSAAEADVAENQVAVLDVQAEDPEGEDVAYAITGGADAALFTIDGATGALAFAQAPDFETPADGDGDNVYEVEVTADDGTRTATQAVAVTVTDDPDEAGEETVVLRVNAFGPAVAAIDGGPDWQADGEGAANSPYLDTSNDRGDAPAAGYTGTADAIPTGVPEAVLDTARSSDASFSYTIPVAAIGGNGLYRVNLYVAELFSGGQAGGFRVFDLALEGQVPAAFDNVDPGGAFGADVGVLSAEVRVTDGALDIGVLKDVVDGQQNPILNAFEVVKVVGPLDDVAPTAAVTLTNPEDASAPLGVAIALSDDGGVDAGTLGAEDLELTVGGFAVAADVTFDGFAEGIATYSIAAPSGGWQDGSDIAVMLLADAVEDVAGNGNVAVSQSAVLDIGGGATGGEEQVLLRINAFGGQVAAIDGGPVWQADGEGAANSPYLDLDSPDPAQDRGDAQGYGGDAAAIPAGVPQDVLNTARSSDAPFAYSIPVSDLAGNGNYTVTLHFAELFPGNQTAGQRSFDVAIEGQTLGALDDVDPSAGVGAGDVLTVSYDVAVTDGTLNIAFQQDLSDNPIVNAIEVASFSGEIDAPPGGSDPSDALAILDDLDDVDSDGSYGDEVGSAKLTITPTGGVRTSNFGGDSFEMENTGGKEIAAVFLDFRDALYGDSVIDFDGFGGDTAAREFGVDSGAGATGAFFEGNNAGTYFLPGDAPLENDTGEGNAPVNGGYRGLLLRFDGTGFTQGEVVGFSGDMDPNSLAGLPKSGPANITNGVGNWDAGGVSGAELIGSAFTVLFDDGTTATGYLGSDGGQSGSVGEAVQGAAEQSVGLTVNGATTIGTYGGAVPVIDLTGPAGATVQVTMTKGLNPVTANAVGAANLVEDRLLAAFPEFPVNNAADFQTVTVTLDGNGQATLDPGSFDYNNASSGEDFGGTSWTEAFETAPMSIAASVVGGGGTPLGPVNRVYLTSNGQPVEAGGGGDPQTVWLAEDGKLVVEAEDGAPIAGGWGIYDSSETPNARGDGFIRWDAGIDTNPGQNGNDAISYAFIADEGGEWTAKVRMASESTSDGAEENDVFIRLLDAAGDPIRANDQGGQSPVTNGDADGTLQSNQWMKFYVGGNKLDSWGQGGQNVDFGGINVGWDLEAGASYTLQIGGRSTGTEIDRIALSNDGAGNASLLANNGAASAIQGEDQGGGGGENGVIRRSIVAPSDDTDQNGGNDTVNLTKADLELGDGGRDLGLRFTDLDLAVLVGADITDAYIEFVGRPSGGSTGTVQATVALENSLSAATFAPGDGPRDRDTFDFVEWTDGGVPGAGQTFRTTDLSGLLEDFIAANQGAVGGGDDLAFVIEDIAGVRKAVAFDADPEDAPVLVIEYDFA